MPFEVSMAFNMVTTSFISGLLLGFECQHRVIISARELGQQLGMSGLMLYILKYKICQALFNVQQYMSKIDKLKEIIYQINNRRSQIWEFKVRIWRITTIYLPQANSETVHVTFSVIWFIFKYLHQIDIILFG